MGKLFGIDGIRGMANSYPIVPEVALQVGKAIARVFQVRRGGKNRALIGKDTRLSGYMLETALTSGREYKQQDSKSFQHLHNCF